MFSTDDQTFLFESIVELLDIPLSYYEKASDRYRSLAEWLHRKESKVADLKPEVHLQGSFLYGTVNRPLRKTEEYDLDLVCQIALSKDTVTQQEVKHLLGDEIKAYADANRIKAPVVERNRCWRLDYADEVLFHMDALPCVPEDQETISDICSQGVPRALAESAVAITDKRLDNYDQVCSDWPCSNPPGLGDWFKDKARPAATARMYDLVAKGAYKSIAEVPSYEWKTPLQQAIQILKRLRDVMFVDDPEFAPISMIITVLAAQAYQGERSVYDALKGIIDRIPDLVRDTPPRIANPVNPGEDFADRWGSDPRHESNFWSWHASAKADLERLDELLGDKQLTAEVRKVFKVELEEKHLKRLGGGGKVPAEAKAAPAVHIVSAPSSWQCGG
jgi:hypothetical protein